MANFRTKARAIDLLGKNQIADLPTAITELWKNGYDAYGDYLVARLYQTGYGDVSHDMFLISDDGRGMDKNDILNKWIVIGTGNKRNINEELTKEERLYKKQRVPLGEKGIGRLSVAYLGNHMLMISKKANSDIQVLFMNWKILDNYEMFLDEVEIPLTSISKISDIDFAYELLRNEFLENFNSDSWDHFVGVKKDVMKSLDEYGKIPEVIKGVLDSHFADKKHGTVFLVFDPISELRELQRENSDEIVLKEDRERAAEQTNYIRSALSGLFNPFDDELTKERAVNLKEGIDNEFTESPCFLIYGSDGKIYDFLNLKDFYTVDEFEECEHWIKGSFDENGKFSGVIKGYNNQEFPYDFKPRERLRTKVGKMELKVAFWEAQQANSIMSPDIWKAYEKKAENYSGLYLYRDGFRVLPYGRTDFDFLGFEENRSKGAGYYYFSHRKMFGYIGITKKGNPQLIDKSGREGLISNEAYRSMRGLLKEFFKEVGVKYFGTASEGRKNFADELAKKKKQDALIAQEKKKNRQQLIELNRQLKERKKELDLIDEEIKSLTKQLSEKITRQQIVKSEERALLSQISKLQLRVVSAKATIAPAVSLEGNESIQDLYYSYEERRKVLETTLVELNKTVMDNVYQNTLADEYTEKYDAVLKEVNQVISLCRDQLKRVIAQITEDVSHKIAGLEKAVRSYSPSVINLDELQEEDTKRYLSELTEKYEEILDVCNRSVVYYLDSLAALDIDGEGLALLAAYKSKEIELASKVDMFYELAQVGMSIDVVDHQFNVLYSQISSELKTLAQEAKKSPNLLPVYEALLISFQHMESNHKMLMPLYRNTRRIRKNITGKDIENILMSFYGKAMDKAGISFVCTESFCNTSYYSYESMLFPVFINIVNNAIYWVGFSDEKRIEIDVQGDKTLIMNSGPKMSHTELTKCFEIFYTKKPSGRGIGLYLAKRNLNAMDLDLYATNDPELNRLDGACFVISTINGEE